jgi:Na+-driven multidrug efflux pump
MMSIEGPYLTALIARMKEPEFNLAAYGVAFSFALIVESPVIMMLSASTALVEGRKSYIKLKSFVYIVNLSLIVLMLIVIFPPVFEFISINLLNLPARVSHLTHIALAILIPWAPSIGYRRFYQGILIRSNKTKIVALGTIVRLTAMSLTAFILFGFTNVHGVIVGASALSMGVIFEAMATRLMSYKVIKAITESGEEGADISFKEIINFYYPLILTSFISLGIHPIVTFFLGQSRMALESLAVLPVLNSLVFLFRAFGLSYQEVGIALIKTKSEFIKLRNFAFGIALFVFAGLTSISFTPLSELWLIGVSGLSEKLADFAKSALMIYTFFPVTTVWINFQRSLLVSMRTTKPITFATVTEISGVILTLLITIKYFDLAGVTAAVISYTAGRLAANYYLIKPFKIAKTKILEREE